MTNRQIAEAMGAKTRWVQALWARYKHQRPADVQFPMPMDRPPDGLPGRREHGAVAGLHAQRRAGGGGHPGARPGPARGPTPASGRGAPAGAPRAAAL